MHRKKAVLSAAAVIAVAASAILLVRPVAASATDKVDNTALAKTLVTQCAGIQENHKVLITGNPRDLELLEDIAIHVRKQGAFPLVSLETDRMTRRMLDDVPAKFDAQTPAFGLKLAEIADAMITIESSEDQALFASAPPERMAALAKAGQPVAETLQKRGIRRVNLGNALYPTKQRAEMFGMTKEALADIFWAGVNVDYTKLQATGDAARKALAAGGEIRITNPNGTDLKARITGRKVFVSDGVISADEIRQGGPAAETWLPAGEVYLAPVPGTAEGKIVVDRQSYEGKTIEGLTLTFKGGKLVSMTGKTNMERLKAVYDAAGEGKDVFGVIDIGINPEVQIPAGSTMRAWMASGMVSVVLGTNTWADGGNTSTFDLSSFLPGCTVAVDGKVIVDKGQLEI